MRCYLPEMNREEVRQALDKATLLVPIATIEQHGPHLPLHTDIDNITKMLLKVAECLNPEPRTIVAPPIWFSPSPFDVSKLPICIKMRKEVYMDALNDILETYLRGGFKKIVVANGHGGGTEKWIPQVIERINQTKISLIWPDWRIPQEAQVVGFCYISFLAEFAREELAKILGDRLDFCWHAGEIETSLQLYLNPDLVDMSKAEKPKSKRKSFKFAPSSLFTFHRQFIIDGYHQEGSIVNDPTVATKELGEEIFKLAVGKISEFIEEFALPSKE